MSVAARDFEEMTMLERRPFRLPMAVTVSFCRDKSGEFLAHALDFDLVCAGTTEAEATHKIRLAMKTYIEYGLSKGWKDYIMYPAPAEFWQRLSPDTAIKLMEPISIMDRQMLVYSAPAHENTDAACEAYR